ncbi:NAD(P)H-binding protein [Hoylesella shahii]|uniref:NAD(P)H-binding protein n=1 Tax=Hoylesella shahii TaxID=228603 RepID=UPI001E5DE956|nr:NAD(P)H-binding protein [Hoylesella shahii]
MKAIVIGATGAVGKDLVEQLLADESVEQVHIFVRRDPQLGTSAKLVTHVVDFNQPQAWQHLVQGDVLFSCMGTTLKAAGSQAAQYTVDYTYQFNFAEAAARNQVPARVAVGSHGQCAVALVLYAHKRRIRSGSSTARF